ncbi:MAG: type IV secretion system DNA-binding domain-containing protein [Nitrososphaera sp.]|nr:type IV secretion system DNA-binding domain-containing protein [Nitrososphaera sp.]
MGFEDKRITFFAKTNARSPHTRRTFGIKHADRRSHMYVIGKTGTGKSTMLETLARQDIEHGHGLTVIDPHGSLVDRLAAVVPDNRRKDLIYFNPTDPAQPYRYNPLAPVSPEKRPLAAGVLLEVFHKIWGERAWGQRMEMIFRNALLAMLDQPDATLPDILRLMRDDDFRKRVAATIIHKPVADFWRYEFPKLTFGYRIDSTSPIVNKISAFLSYPTLFKVLTESGKMLDFREIMDNRKILLVNLSSGKLGLDAAALLGAMLVTSIGLAGFSRADMPEEERVDHYLYLDEFQNVTTLTMANMLSELRKFRLSMTMAHQYMHQLEPDVQHAVLGNAATIISFRLGAKDAPLLAREFAPTFGVIDLLNLPNYHIYLKLLIDGTPSRPFSAATILLSEKRRSAQ